MDQGANFSSPQQLSWAARYSLDLTCLSTPTLRHRYPEISPHESQGQVRLLVSLPDLWLQDLMEIKVVRVFFVSKFRLSGENLCGTSFLDIAALVNLVLSTDSFLPKGDHCFCFSLFHHLSQGRKTIGQDAGKTPISLRLKLASQTVKMNGSRQISKLYHGSSM